MQDGGDRVGAPAPTGKPRRAYQGGKGVSASVKIVSWNIAGSIEAWRVLAGMNVDIALLQEAGAPPADIAGRVEVNPAPWSTVGWLWQRRTAIAKLSDCAEVEWIEAKSFVDADSGELAVSRPGTLTAAVVKSPDIKPFVVGLDVLLLGETPRVGGRAVGLLRTPRLTASSPTCPCLSGGRMVTASWPPETSTSSMDMGNTEMDTGLHVTGRCSTGWRRWGCLF